MNRLYLPRFSGSVTDRKRISLHLFWIMGLLCGGLLALFADNPASLMRMPRHLSIVGLLLIPLFPFLISAFAVYLSRPRLIYAVCFLKAFCFCACAVMIRTACGSAGWLMQALLLFTDGLTTPVLYWFWLRCLDGSDAVRSAWVCAGLFAMTAAVDWEWIAPFLNQIL